MKTSTSLVLGYNCNNNCIFCLYGDKRGMRCLEDLKKSLENLRRYGDDIMLTGGSAYRSDYLDILKYAKKLGFKVHIDHNLRTFSDKEFAKKVLKIYPNAIFSAGLHSPEPKIHDKITRMKGSWKETVKGIKNIIELGNRNITIVFVICKLNFNMMPEMVKFVKKLGVSRLDFVLVRKEGRAEKIYRELLPSIKEFKPYLMEAIKKAEMFKLPLKVYGLPLCIINPKYSFELEAINIDKIIWDIEGEKNNELEGRSNIRIKFPKCKRCRYFFICMGPLEAYTKIYCGDEFVPIEGEYIKTLHKLKQEIIWK